MNSYFSGPVLNNELFFANGKILPIFVDQTIAIIYIYHSETTTYILSTAIELLFKENHFIDRTPYLLIDFKLFKYGSASVI